RVFDKLTGKLLWETTLPAAGNATPAMYEVNGRQFVVIAAGGGKSKEPPGGRYIAFALKKEELKERWQGEVLRSNQGVLGPNINAAWNHGATRSAANNSAVARSGSGGVSFLRSLH